MPARAIVAPATIAGDPARGSTGSPRAEAAARRERSGAEGCARTPLAYTFGIAFSTARPSFTSTLKSTDFALKRVISSGTCFAMLLATAS